MAFEQRGTLECQHFTQRKLWSVVLQPWIQSTADRWYCSYSLWKKNLHIRGCIQFKRVVQRSTLVIVSLATSYSFFNYSSNEHCPSHHHSSLGKQPPVITDPWLPLLNLYNTFSTQQRKKKNHIAPYIKSTRAFYTLPHPGLPGPVTRSICFLGLT